MGAIAERLVGRLYEDLSAGAIVIEWVSFRFDTGSGYPEKLELGVYSASWSGEVKAKLSLYSHSKVNCLLKGTTSAKAWEYTKPPCTVTKV